MNHFHRHRRRLPLGIFVLVGAGLALEASSASAEPVEYVRICSQFGANFLKSPGSDNCADTAPLEFRKVAPWGEDSDYVQNSGRGNLVYGTNGYAG